ncbi:DUF6876 family protein [Thalassoglobus sp.]|uniref:DUF6876 family protein n=1 Tax=Thalassoglobus sp. TaxID=2795869 RepID=UPI003AA878D7
MTNHNPQLEEDVLRMFTGTSKYFRHSINRNVLFTDGVRHVAEEGEAFWLIDAIAIWLTDQKFREEAQKDDRIQSLHFWKLTVNEDRSAILTAKADSPEEPFITQAILFTDFPLDSIDIWVGNDGEYWTLYLPSEH